MIPVGIQYKYIISCLVWWALGLDEQMGIQIIELMSFFIKLKFH